LAKYIIKARIEVDGIVEKHDIIGALFGLTEGLFGEYFDLKTLQDKGRIGRIITNIKVQGGKTVGEIIIPSNLDRVETALLIAMIETVDKVGPFDAKIKLVDIIDVRLEKIKKIIDRAAEILSKWSKEKIPDIKEVIRELQERIKIAEPISYGPEELPAGPGVDSSDTIIIVEGRADVINLLRYGYTNVIAIGGAKRVPETIKKLSKSKNVIVFLDGDHAGDLILKELLREIKIDYIARAPTDREVEDLTGREIEDALSNKQEVFEYLDKMVKSGDKDAKQLIEIQRKLHGIVEEKKIEKPEVVEKVEKPVVQPVAINIPSNIIEIIKSIQGTLESIIYNQEWSEVKRLPVRDLVTYLNTLSDGSNIYAIVMDGIITQRLIDAASSRNVKLIIGARISKISYKPENITLLTFEDLL